MTNEQFLTLILAIVVHTGALVWWGATLTATVRHHDRRLEDHEMRLREREARG